jgi:lipid intermediate transporter
MFLLFLLTIWRPSQLPNRQYSYLEPISGLVAHAARALDDDRLDREWIIRNVLGGMSAGFGLRGMFVTGRQEADI